MRGVWPRCMRTFTSRRTWAARQSGCPLPAHEQQHGVLRCLFFHGGRKSSTLLMAFLSTLKITAPERIHFLRRGALLIDVGNDHSLSCS